MNETDFNRQVDLTLRAIEDAIDANGADIQLVRGQTWVAAVPNSSGAVSWQ